MQFVRCILSIQFILSHTMLLSPMLVFISIECAQFLYNSQEVRSD